MTTLIINVTKIITHPGASDSSILRGFLFIGLNILKYNKPILTVKELIDLLKSRGLIINDEEYAYKVLSTIGYFRLKVYFIPFYKPNINDTFIDGTIFEEILNLYLFDQELKAILSYYLGNIEIELKSTFNYILLGKEKDYYCYLDLSLYSENPKNLNELKDFFEYIHNHLNKSFSKGEELYIKHFKNVYLINHIPTLIPKVPIWIFLETVTFGMLSKFYEILKVDLKEEISKKYGLTEEVLSSWLHFLSYIRNLIAHYSRLWDKTKELRILPLLPKKDLITKHRIYYFYDSTKINKIPNNNLFCITSIIHYLNSFIPIFKNQRNLKTELNDLFKKYNLSAGNLEKMGFLSDWEHHEIWKK